MKRLTLIALALAMTASCTVTSSPSGPAYPSEPPPPPPEEHGSHQHEGPPPPPPSSDSGVSVSGRIRVKWRVDRAWAPMAQKEWIELGRAVVKPGTTDQHVQGRVARQTWRALAFRVEGTNPLDVYDVILHLGGGKGEYAPEIKHTFREGERTVIIDLPEHAESIESMTFRYGSVTTGGASVILYGLPVN
jgi:hypothetical protein